MLGGVRCGVVRCVCDIVLGYDVCMRCVLWCGVSEVNTCDVIIQSIA